MLKNEQGGYARAGDSEYALPGSSWVHFRASVRSRTGSFHTFSLQGQQEARSGVFQRELLSLGSGLVPRWQRWLFPGRSFTPCLHSQELAGGSGELGNATCSGTGVRPIPRFTQTSLLSHFCTYARECFRSWDGLVDIRYPTEWSLANYIYICTHIYIVSQHFFCISPCVRMDVYSKPELKGHCEVSFFFFISKIKQCFHFSFTRLPVLVVILKQNH